MTIRKQTIAVALSVATAALCFVAPAAAGQSFRKNAPRIEACKQAIVDFYIENSREPIAPETVQALNAPLIAACKRHRGDPRLAIGDISSNRRR